MTSAGSPGCPSLRDYFHYFWLSVCSPESHSYVLEALSSGQGFKAAAVSATRRMTHALECLGNEHTNFYGLHISEDNCAWEIIQSDTQTVLH